MEPLRLGPADPENGYPRPLLQRDGWAPLNGAWSFALDRDAHWTKPSQVEWDERTIFVPFAPETAASGIHDTGFFSACWYRKTILAPPHSEQERIILHFGAVDYEATVWVDEAVVARHTGGYTPFEVDITSFLRSGGEHVVTVRAFDDPHDLAKPRGKQDWQLEPHSIWYRRTTGIWQTVWLEVVPATRIIVLRCEPSLERWEIDIDAELGGPTIPGAVLEVTLRTGETLLAADVYTFIGGTANRAIRLSDPGIDDSRNDLLWNPAHPRLISIDAKIRDAAGNLVDVVRSYTALRSVSVEGDRFLLNGRPFFLRMVLDQGYWPGTGLTPPDDASIRADVELAKAMGFNGVRKHQKIEDPRYLYWADVLGLMVWEEMPSAYRFTKRSVERLTKEWIHVLERDRAHPCIVAWVPINESWGVPNLPRSPTERDYVRTLYHLTKTLDPSRPVVGNDGWESVATDIVGIHDYDDDPTRIARRYHADEVLPKLFQRERPAGRRLVLDATRSDLPLVLSEFGGITVGAESGTWGYSRCVTPDEFGVRYAQLLEVVRSLGLISGFCYTQFADTYQEANGLLRSDRTPKLPIEFIAAATRGPRIWPLLMQEGALAMGPPDDA
jgi:beta-galactosidase/beta-glucuronidase